MVDIKVCFVVSFLDAFGLTLNTYTSHHYINYLLQSAAQLVAHHQTNPPTLPKKDITMPRDGEHAHNGPFEEEGHNIAHGVGKVDVSLQCLNPAAFLDVPQLSRY